jgi:hypothetical protein
MNKTIFVRTVSPLLLALLMSAGAVSCTKKPSREKNARENLDYLFLDLFFGMQRQEFFDYCLEMNKQKKFIHGTGGSSNANVEYLLKDELPEPVIMRFYPNFHEEKIYEIPVLFTYASWAPWNKEYWSDKLLEQIHEVFKKWYGDDFKVINHPRQGKIYAKMDGYRRINLFIRDDQYVQAVFTDMRVETKKNKAGE